MTSAPDVLKKPRREGLSGRAGGFTKALISASFLCGGCMALPGMLRHSRGSALDGFLDALVGAAAADVAAHRGIDVGIGWVGVLAEQGTGRHDLARLAVTALHDVDLDPGILHAPAGFCFADVFDSRDALAL